MATKCRAPGFSLTLSHSTGECRHVVSPPCRIVRHVHTLRRVAERNAQALASAAFDARLPTRFAVGPDEVTTLNAVCR